MATERFEIQAEDEDGRPVVLRGVRQINEYPTMSDGTLRSPGLAELFDPSGDRVNDNRDGTFTAVRSEKVYRAI